ncbi:MAG: methyl-accepting chemotaxis protein [Marinisporobacter sp.]|jgi:methyl-accepting chemotaxis protein|nr:methyl-accepting chemotaxis protein [Marinisporobacter sp.]
MNNKKLKGIQGKLVLNFIILGFIITIISGMMQYYVCSQRILETTRQNAMQLATAATLLIDGNDHERLLKSKASSSNLYKDIRSKMRAFQEQTGVTGIYTLAELGNDQTQFIIDAAKEDAATLGDAYDYLEAMKDAFDGSSSADEELITDRWGTTISGYAPVRNSNKEVVAIVGIDIDASHITKQKNQILIHIIIHMILSVFLSLILAIFLSKKIVQPIYLLVDRFKELSLAGGDLTKKIEIKTGDELEALGNAVTDFIEKMKDIIIEINHTSKDVASSAYGLNKSLNENKKAVEEISNAIEGIAIGASKGSENIHDVSSMVQGIAINITDNEKKVEKINASIEKSKKLITTGLDAVNHQSIKTKENTDAFIQVTQVVENLAQEAESVKTILSTITNISEQTNLLALNAAIEAARAGEHGKGFSVVADEVRKLAAQSTTASTEIGQILQKIDTDAKQAIEAVNHSNLIVNEQKIAVNNTNKAFKDMTKEIEVVMNDINIINTSFKDIAKNTDHIATKMHAISLVSQDNVAITEEVSANSEEENAAIEDMGKTSAHLDQLSRNLNEIVSKFKI